MAETTTAPAPRYPGVPTVIHGNGAVAYVMGHVCGGVIGYPITPSTEISEIFEAGLAEGGVNVWGKHPFFFSPEGEHSAQSGALGAALTGGQYVSNASSSQGILYAMESHYVTVGKKVGGFVLQVAARVVSRHSLNVMAGHDDVYGLLSSGYTILFGATPQEAADLAAIAYRTSSLSLIPVANAMDGFATSHMLSEARLPEPELLREYLGDPAGRIPSPTVAQEMLFGARGRVHQLRQYLGRREGEFCEDDLAGLRDWLDAHASEVERDNGAELLGETERWVPETLWAPWGRQWRHAHERGTRQRVPALVDPDNPGLTGPVQNQPDFQAGAVDHRTHFAGAVPGLVRRAMAEYGALTGRHYSPVHTVMCEDADYVMVGLGSVTEDVEAVLPYLRSQGIKAGLVAVKLLQPFPEAELVEALRGTKAVTVLERSDHTALTTFVTQALFKARENAAVGTRHPGVPPLVDPPPVTTAVFGLGGHDLQPRHLVAAYRAMVDGSPAPLVYLGSQFFSEDPPPETAEIQARLRAAYPETELMGLPTGPNPSLMPAGTLRIRFHSVGGYGTIATGKLLTDILAGALGLHSKSAPKYGSEKSGAPTNYYITLSPEPVKITNAELEDVEVVISPDHKVFHHTDPLRGLVEGGTFVLQSALDAEAVWASLPRAARHTIRERGIHLLVVDAFAVAREHAPAPELETRMMGIAFIGAVAGHVPAIARGASQEAILAKVREQVATKFGAKGDALVESNLAVVRAGSEATWELDHDRPELQAIDRRPDPLPLYTSSLSAQCECANATGCAATGIFDREYYDNMTAKPFREGTIGEAPVLPGAGLFMPAGTAATKDKGLFRRTVPEFHADACTGCLECTLVCPDAAIPNTVHEIHELLLTGIAELDLPPAQDEALRGQVHALAARVREAYRATKEPVAFHDLVAEAAAGLPADPPSLGGNAARLVERLATYPVARTRPFFDAMEQQAPGTGGLFAATIDPWKCTGCLECVDVCGPHALVARDQDDDLAARLQERFAFMSRTPDTAARFHTGSTSPDGDVKRLFLSRDNYYATTGGHGGCRGCGEVTAIRLVMSTSHALGGERRSAEAVELDGLLGRLRRKPGDLGDGPEAAARRGRIHDALSVLERRLYELESGPTGRGSSSTIIANATGCSSVYASTMPYNPYNDPWVNSLFQDAQPLAKGIFEGVAAQVVDVVRARRVARLELEDAYDPDRHDEELRVLQWAHFTREEMELLPTVLTIGGDGATYDIGFGALSRVLASETPIKIMVLNTGVYSNTGGQASTSSFTGQDSDLARFGHAQEGKHETRKELGLIASFHPHVFVCATSTALQGHFLRNTLEFLTYGDAPAVMDVYTPCGSEHGIADDASAQRARLAVESRMNPVFVHDPRRGSSLHDWFSLEGNPDPGETWTTTTVEHLDENGELQLFETPLTPADFALGEVRFKKHFHRLGAEEGAASVPIDAYVDLSPAQRRDHVPFVWATDPGKQLIKVGASDTIVALVEDRRRYWQVLQFLAGVHLDRLTALHQSDVDDLRARYEEARQARESSLDQIADAMAELATSSQAQPSPLPGPGLGGVAPAAGAAPGASSPPEAESDGPPVVLSEEDQLLCNNCKTCYQDLPQLFEKTKKVVHGEVREVAQLIPGALEKVELTDEVRARLTRVAANCDAEIIHVQ